VAPDHEYISSLITDYFSYQLFEIVTEIYMRKPLEQINADEIINSDQEDAEDDYDEEDALSDK